jgi:hypothetical protein
MTLSREYARIDKAILSVVSDRWAKVARVIVEASRKQGGAFPSESEYFGMVGKRIAVLVRRGRLEARGDIKKWRFSEIRRVDADQSGN